MRLDLSTKQELIRYLTPMFLISVIIVLVGVSTLLYINCLSLKMDLDVQKVEAILEKRHTSSLSESILKGDVTNFYRDDKLRVQGVLQSFMLD